VPIDSREPSRVQEREGAGRDHQVGGACIGCFVFSGERHGFVCLVRRQSGDNTHRWSESAWPCCSPRWTACRPVRTVIKIHRKNRTLGYALLDLRPILVRLLDALLVALAGRLFQHGHHPQRDQSDLEEQSNDAEHDLVD
jgi:hypothetical protein